MLMRLKQFQCFVSVLFQDVRRTYKLFYRIVSYHTKYLY